MRNLRALVPALLACHACLAGCLAGCGDASGPLASPEATGERASALTLPTTPFPSDIEASSPGRFVGELLGPPYACPPASPAPSWAGAWQGGPLFGSSAAVLGPSPPPPPPLLAGFCVYQWTGPDDPAAWAFLLPSDPAGRPASDWLRPDKHVAAPLGGSGTADDFLALHDDFRRQVSAPWVIPSGIYSPIDNARVAVVDSAPGSTSGAIPQGRLPHGHAIATLIDDLLCPRGSGGNPTGPCFPRPTTHLGLPMLSPTEADYSLGGYFGRQTDLALAVEQAVVAWRKGPRSQLDNALPRLVINLSVGWEGAWGGNAPPELLDPPARAVYRVLQHAACLGAVAVASAGNDPGGPDPAHGPMFPAGWEQQPAPGPDECAQLEGGVADDVTWPAFSAAPRPLVYAAGGVDAFDMPLASTREGGRPRLVAPSAHAVGVTYGKTLAYHPSFGYPKTFGWFEWVSTTDGTSVLTGTSVSAAVVSAAAALLWSYHPELPPAEVMQMLADSAFDLPPDPATGRPRTADFCSPTGEGCGEPQRRVSLCRAARQACSSGGVFCPSGDIGCDEHPPYSFAPGPLPPGTRASLDAAATSSLAMSLIDAQPVPADEPCRSEVFTSREPEEVSVACPDRQFQAQPSVPWVGPQPSTPQCPNCVIALHDWGSYVESTLWLSFGDATLSPTLTDPVLSLTLRGGEVVRFDLSPTLTTLYPYSRYRLSTSLPERFPVWSVTSASLSARVEGSLRYESATMDLRYYVE